MRALLLWTVSVCTAARPPALRETFNELLSFRVCVQQQMSDCHLKMLELKSWAASAAYEGKGTLRKGSKPSSCLDSILRTKT
mmetsp:Transcript_77626/g.171473  ORF Transcript_77626/g.171473 Transcript_77626/m.171473 type:complete len:82 (-) Transcript_77626:341-586(-)